MYRAPPSVSSALKITVVLLFRAIKCETRFLALLRDSNLYVVRGTGCGIKDFVSQRVAVFLFECDILKGIKGITFLE